MKIEMVNFAFTELMNFVLAFLFFALQATTLHARISRQEYYNALSSDKLEVLQKMIDLLNKEKSSTLINAYKGALLAKKADFEKSPTQKLADFKAGAELLESAIDTDPKNVEYRFLRLSVQEHSPKLVRYKDDLEGDKRIIIQSFSKLDSELQSIILDYAEKSTVLRKEDLRNK